MRFLPISSSSKGNAYVVEHDGRALLIDCGVPLKEVEGRCREAGVDAGCVEGVLVTHNHSDHISCLRPFLRRHDVPVYANALTADAVAAATGLDADAFVIFENEQDFEAGKFSVRPFSIPHDTPDPVGYLVSTTERTYFHGTDMGSPLESVGRMFSLADEATLESNHDVELLLGSARSEMLKRRILGPRGHLSNDDAADFAAQYASARLKRLHLAHLSGECNVPRVALKTMVEALARAGRADIEVDVLEQGHFTDCGNMI